MAESKKKFSVKAGRFEYDIETKKVKVNKAKGQLSVYTNEEYENHVSWVNLETKVEEVQLMVFPFDATFEKVTDKNNVFVLRFQSNEERYFFWLQEKVDQDQFVKKISSKIAFSPDQEEIQPQPEKMQVEEPQNKQEKKKVVKNEGGINQDWISKLTSNLMAAQKKQEGITHLSKILTPDAINLLLNELKEEDSNQLIEHLPEEQRGVEHIASNVRSPQFQQAFDVLSDALNSENVFPLFMQMGLDQKYLKKHYGVHAFLLAMQQKYKQSEQKMQVQKKQQPKRQE